MTESELHPGWFLAKGQSIPMPDRFRLPRNERSLMNIKSIHEVDGKILLCETGCTYDIETHKGEHSWGCRYGSLADLKVSRIETTKS